MNILNKQSRIPYYTQISTAYEKLIKTGYFSYGEKLATLTEIKEIFNVSLKVAAQAYDDLSKKGLIYSRRGKGFYVSYREKFNFDLSQFHIVEYQLMYEMEMQKHMLLFEKIEAFGYVAKQLSLRPGEQCYHIKQSFGKGKTNVLFQDVYLPLNIFPHLENHYEKYSTLPSLIEQGYQIKLANFTSRYFPVQASAEEEFVLRLLKGDPLWRVESIYYSSNAIPMALVNRYLSGEYIKMVVVLNEY